MKSLLLFILSIGCIPAAFSQEKDLSVVATAGGGYEINDVQLDWTLGEVIIQYLEKPGIIVSQGFHQPVYSLVSVHAIPEDVGMISVFPNPFSDQLDVKMTYKNSVTGAISLQTMNGTEIWRKKFEGKDIHEIYDSTTLPSGSYVLMVSLVDNAYVQTYTIVKTQ